MLAVTLFGHKEDMTSQETVILNNIITMYETSLSSVILIYT